MTHLFLESKKKTLIKKVYHFINIKNMFNQSSIYEGKKITIYFRHGVFRSDSA